MNTRIIALSILLLVASICSGQMKLTLEQCKIMALQYDQQIKSAKAGLSASEASYTLSKRSRLPQFDFVASYTYLHDPAKIEIPSFELQSTNSTPSGVLFPGIDKQMAYHNSYNTTLGISFPIYLGGKLNAYGEISGNVKQIAENNVVYEKSEVLYSTEERYWSLVSLKEKKLLVEKSIAFLNDLVRVMQNRYDAELVTKNEVLKTKVDLNNSKLSLTEVTDGIQLSKMSLNKLIGNDILTDIVVIDSIIDIPDTLILIKYIENSLANRPEIKIMENQLEIAKSQLKVLESDYKPHLVSFANYMYQNPNHLGIDEGEFTWLTGVSLKVPVFHWGEKKLKRHEQNMENKQIELQYEATREYLTLEIHQAIYKLKESLEKIELTKQSLIQADENLKLERNRLQEGLITTTDVLNAQMQWQKSYSDFIDAKTNFKVSESKYFKTIGELVD